MYRCSSALSRTARMATMERWPSRRCLWPTSEEEPPSVPVTKVFGAAAGLDLSTRTQEAFCGLSPHARIAKVPFGSIAVRMCCALHFWKAAERCPSFSFSLLCRVALCCVGLATAMPVVPPVPQEEFSYPPNKGIFFYLLG